MRIVQVDAFREDPYLGNPAGVCILSTPETDEQMQAVARTMDLSETAFVTAREGAEFDLRWFTPASEVALCGHATLATAHILWEEGVLPAPVQARFQTRSGLLVARKVGAYIALDFPAKPAVAAEAPPGLVEVLGVKPCYVGRSQYDYLIEVATAEEVKAMTPDFAQLMTVPVRGIIVTAPSADPQFDFVSRFFAPAVGVNEDPATGSAHCTLMPFWAEKLGRNRLTACQLSKRGGVLKLELNGDRVQLAGKAVTTGQRVL